MVGAAVPDRIVTDNLQLMLCYLQQTAASWGQHDCRMFAQPAKYLQSIFGKDNGTLSYVFGRDVLRFVR